VTGFLGIGTARYVDPDDDLFDDDLAYCEQPSEAERRAHRRAYRRTAQERAAVAELYPNVKAPTALATPRGTSHPARRSR
jgi:hypothetical protein